MAMKAILRVMTGTVILCAGGLQAASEPAGIRLFDCGSSRTPLMAGFEQVTRKTTYTPERGYGWEQAGSVREAYGAIAGGKRENPGAPDALTGDFLLTKGKASFRIDLPAGRYRVVAYVDGWQSGRLRFRGYRIQANGQEVARLDWTHKRFLSEDYYFKDWNHDFDPAECVWTRWAQELYRTERFEAASVNGALRLGFSNEMQVFGLVVYPAARQAAGAAALEQVDAHRRAEFYSTYFRRAVPDPEPLPDLTTAERGRGYLVFSRHVFSNVDIGSAPRRAELGRPLELFAAQGEAETATFTVLPLEDLGEIAVHVGELRGPAGTLPASSVQIECCRYRWHPTGPRHEPRPMILMPWSRVKGHARYNRRFYLTVRPPAAARPGIYTGSVRISVADKPATDLPMRLRVLPFRLPTLTEVGFSAGYYYWGPRKKLFYDRMGTANDPEAERWLERDLRLMKAFNLNGFQPARDAIRILDFDKLAAGDPAALDFSTLDRDLAAARRVGMDGVGSVFLQGVHNQLIKKWPFGSDGYRVRAGAFFRLLGEHVRAQGGPELLAWLTDEVRESGLHVWNLNHDDTLRYCRIVREGAGNAIRTTLSLMSDTGGAKDYTDLVPACDVTQTHFWDKSKRIIETARKGGHELWSYNSGTSRYSWGYQAYVLGAKGRWQWHYFAHNDRPYSPISEARYIMAFYTPTAHLATPGLIEAREGLDDYLYLRLLEQALARKRGSAAARAEAKRTLADVRRLAPFGIKLADGADAGGGATAVLPSPEDYDRLRWRVAQAILGLGQSATAQPKR